MGNTAPETYVTLAGNHVRAAHALRDDLLAVLFPYSGALPSELLQSRIRMKIKDLTSSIEQALMRHDDEQPNSWAILSESGLLREKALIDFALARLAEESLNACLRLADGAAPLSQLPALFLGHENVRIADMARALLHAAQVSESNNQLLHHRLDSEQLHQTCWRVAAALIEGGVVQSDSITEAVHSMLALHDGGLNPLTIARKIVFFLGFENRAELNDPRRAGLHLFVANLGREYDLDDDFILRLIGGHHPAPLLLLLKGLGIATDTALAIVQALKGKEALDTFTNLGSDYASLDSFDARAAILSWREEAAA